MPRHLFDYGIETPNASDFVVENPAFIDGVLVRMTEDIDLSIQVYALVTGQETISFPLAERVLRRLNMPLDNYAVADTHISDTLRRQTRRGFRTYRRGPLTYEAESEEMVANTLAGITHSVLVSGQSNAAEEGMYTIEQRHLLSVCDELPYPLKCIFSRGIA